MQVVQAVAPDEEEIYSFNAFPGKEQMLIDCESWVGYGEMAWEAFAAEHPTELVEMRIFLQPTDYYNYEFADDLKYQCFSLGAKGSEASLYGYVERDSDTARDLLAAVSPRRVLPSNAVVIGGKSFAGPETKAYLEAQGIPVRRQ
ncbi:MAG: hypothetical protein OSA48_08395 [Akkermansiaceae bacterium]|mgnify:FL=1|nr:hypothetical protein [Akkermansiaceae bacterium]